MAADIPIWPTICSTIAAACSAIAAVVMVLIQRRNSIEAARPELVITNWDRNTRGTTDNPFDVIGFSTIRNMGTGPALHVCIGSRIDGNPPRSGATGGRIMILAPAQEDTIDGELIVYWKNIVEERRIYSVTLELLCWDTRGGRYTTHYSMIICENRNSVLFSMDIVAPGVGVFFRDQKRDVLYSLKARKAIRRGWAKLQVFFQRKSKDKPVG